jgi:polysaccharide pyruvyl transferase WcaK-like protein
MGYIKLLKLLDREGVNYKIYITDHRDLPVAKKIMGNRENIIFNESPEKLLAELDDCDLMVGYRLHALIPALSSGIPVIPIPLDGRISGFVETYGLTEYSVNPYDPSSELLILERIKLALRVGILAWEPTIERRNNLALVMRNFINQSLANI